MLTKWQLWLQIFLAALQSLLQEPGTTTHTALEKARAAADEGMNHMPAALTATAAAPSSVHVHCPNCSEPLIVTGELAQGARGMWVITDYNRSTVGDPEPAAAASAPAPAGAVTDGTKFEEEESERAQR